TGVARAGVAVVRAGRAAGHLGVRGAAGSVARAEVVPVAFADRRTAHSRRGQEHVGRARGAAPRAGLGDVAGACRRPAHRAGVAVALVGRAHLAVVRARRPRGLHRIRRTGGARPGTALGEVAFVGRRPARRPRVARVVDAQRVAGRAVALVGGAHVAVVRARRPRRLDRVARTVGTVAGTGLRDVALVRRRSTDERRRPEGVRRTRTAAPGARLGDVAPPGRGSPADRPRLAG